MIIPSPNRTTSVILIIYIVWENLSLLSYECFSFSECILAVKKKKEKKGFKSLNTVQGHSWSNPDDQKMLQALQNKPDKAYTFLIT